MIQTILSVVGDVQIFPAIVVVVADAHALAPSGGGQPGFRGHIGERPVVIVVIQVIGGSVLLRESFERRAVHDENVGPAVVVVIKDGDAGAGGFNDVFLGVDSRQKHLCNESSRLVGDVREVGDGAPGLAAAGRAAVGAWPRNPEASAETDGKFKYRRCERRFGEKIEILPNGYELRWCRRALREELSGGYMPELAFPRFRLRFAVFAG